MRITNEQLKAFLEDANLVEEKDLTKAFEEAEKKESKLGDILLKKELINEEQLTKLRAYILGIPFVDLSKEVIDPDILNIVPEPIARKNKIVAYRINKGTLEVAMTNPEDVQIIDFVRKKSGLKVLPRLTTEEGVKNALKQYGESLEAEFEGLMGEGEEEKEGGDKKKSAFKIEKGKGVEDIQKEDKDLQKEAEELPIIRMVDSILKHAIKQRASDIHIEPEEKDVIVRYRVDGVLHDAMTLPKQVQDGIVARIKVLSKLRLDEHRLPQDGRFTIHADDGKVSFRVSILPVYDGEKIVMRLLREGAQGLTFEQMGLGGEALERLQRAIHKSTGIILVTGPTGSGKTTTLYTVLDILNRPDVNISTIEDPVEYRMPRVNQTQVKPEIGMTFASGLRALVRQDPDILMVGEIRDGETASLAINAALTGHLVLSTLHTNSAAGAMPRLIDMEQEPFLISSTANVIVGQRLVRRLCPDTREKYKLSKKELETLSHQVDLDRLLKILKSEKAVDEKATWDTIDFYKPGKSKDCPDGYSGRLGIYEVLEVSEGIKKLINQSASTDEINRQAKQEGMLTMLEDGFVKAIKGITTIEEVLRVTNE